MKKYLWIVALIAALAMVMAGCDNGGGGGGGTQAPDYDEVTFFTLTEYLADLVDDGTFDVDTDIDTTDADDGNTTFDDLKIQPAGVIGLQVVDNNGKYALAIDTKTFVWGAGVDFKNSELTFKEHDKITISGRILEDFPAAPTGGNSWATPMVYFATDLSDTGARTSILSTPKKNQTYTTTETLTAVTAFEISKSKPYALRVGGRPNGAKFTIDELTIVRRVPKEKVEYTVTFYSDDKTTTLSSTKIEKGDFIPRPAAEDWFTTYKAGIASDKQFDKWYDKATDAPWVFSTQVTKDIGLYAVLDEKEVVPATVIILGAPDGDAWETGTDFTFTNLKDTKYFVVKALITDADGMGGFQLAGQVNGDWSLYYQWVSGDWTDYPTGSAVGDKVYVVFNIDSTVTDSNGDSKTWAQALALSASTAGKFAINTAPDQLDIEAGYASTATLTKGSDAKDFNSGAGKGWITKVAPW